jgi:hypothetical protein
LGFLKRGSYSELILSCVPICYARVEPHATDTSFDQEDTEDPEYVVPDNECFNGNEGVMSLPTILDASALLYNALLG